MKIVNKVLSFLTPRDTKILVSLFYSYKALLYKRVISLFSYISLFLAQYLQTGTSSCSTTRFDQQQSKIIKSLMRFYSLAIKKTKKDKTSLFLAYQILWNGILKPMARFIYEEGIKKDKIIISQFTPTKTYSSPSFCSFFSFQDRFWAWEEYHLSSVVDESENPLFFDPFLVCKRESPSCYSTCQGKLRNAFLLHAVFLCLSSFQNAIFVGRCFVFCWHPTTPVEHLIKSQGPIYILGYNIVGQIWLVF